MKLTVSPVALPSTRLEGSYQAEDMLDKALHTRLHWSLLHHHCHALALSIATFLGDTILGQRVGTDCNDPGRCYQLGTFYGL